MDPTCQTLLNAEDIDAAYIPLSNGLHHKWAWKSLKPEKNVLLEKLSTSHPVEAEKLFWGELLKQHLPTGPEKDLVLWEAVHTFFHPAFRKFLSLINRLNVVKVCATLELSKKYYSTR